MPRTAQHHLQIIARAKRTRTSLAAAGLELPRLSVDRSLRSIRAQIIDDKAGKTLCSASDRLITKGTKTERAEEVGTMIAQLALKAKVKAVRFDRGAFRYHGRVAALADAARKAGLTF